MGYGAYSHDRHVQSTTMRAKAASTGGAETVFTQRSCHPTMDPMGLTVRQSRDSAEHPESLSILFALDVTGSMGNIPKNLATQNLPHFVKALIDAGIPHPQVLFAAVGDTFSDRAPLQVGQFESSDELMDQWLTRVWLEGGGGGNGHESYDLALYLAARHTSIDCWERRQKKGYLFITGDEKIYPEVSPASVLAVFGTALEAPIPLDALVREVRQQWEPFFLVPNPARDAICGATWRAVLGDRTIVLDDPEATALAAASIVALNEGTAPDLGAIARQLTADGVAPRIVQGIVRSLTPFAQSIGRAEGGLPVPDESA
jgi:hypothetical protein